MGFFGLTKKKTGKKANKDNDKKSKGAAKNEGNAAAASKKKKSEQPSLSQTTNPVPEQKQPQQSKTAQQSAAASPNNKSNNNNNNNGTTQVTNIPAGDPAFATPDVTRNLVKKFISDIWNRGELELIPQVCSPKIRFNGMSGLDKIGHEGFAMMVSTIHAAFTDYHCEIHSMVVESNKAFCRLRFSGKFTGTLMGYQPHGNRVSWMGASEFTCLNGLILKVWELGDMKTLEEQLAGGGVM